MLNIRFLPYALAVLARLILPLFIWRNVFWVTIGSVILDIIDGDLFRLGSRSRKNKTYQAFDKILDFYWHGFALLYCQKFKIFGLFLAFFVWRTIGTVLFLKLKKRRIFFFFPNVFENLFVFFVLANSFPSLSFLIRGKNFYLSLAFLTGLKLIQEYSLHIKKFSFHDWLIGGKWQEN